MVYPLRDTSVNYWIRMSTRTKPSDGKTRKLLRIMQGKYAMSVVDVARNLKTSRRNAWRYISKLEAEGKIYLRYRQRLNYYSLRRSDEDGQTGNGVAQNQSVVWFRYD